MMKPILINQAIYWLLTLIGYYLLSLKSWPLFAYCLTIGVATPLLTGWLWPWVYRINRKP